MKSIPSTNGSGSGKPKNVDPVDPDPEHWVVDTSIRGCRFVGVYIIHESGSQGDDPLAPFLYA
jgi:hypothetical protein